MGCNSRSCLPCYKSYELVVRYYCFGCRSSRLVCKNTILYLYLLLFLFKSDPDPEPPGCAGDSDDLPIPSDQRSLSAAGPSSAANHDSSKKNKLTAGKLELKFLKSKKEHLK